MNAGLDREDEEAKDHIRKPSRYLPQRGGDRALHSLGAGGMCTEQLHREPAGSGAPVSD